MDSEYSLTGGAEEWLRRIALTRPLTIVPDVVVAVLIEIGFVEKLSDGSLAATASGGAYLDSRGIAHGVAPPKYIPSTRREVGKKVGKRSVHAPR